LEASQVCRLALRNDPCRESFLRALLESLIKLGRPDWAEAQFTSWCRSLEEEYGLQPTHETLRVYQQLLADRNSETC
jgi:DNA-binding SARP family transcriptional activator